jgi:hypothetical protein
MSFKDDIKLDVADLDHAALEQPSLCAEWGEKWAQAVLDRDRLKERLTSRRAEIDEEIRKSPESFGNEGGKITETWIASKVQLHEDVVSLNQELLEAQYNVNMMSVARDALDHRLKALSTLTELYKGNYFSAAARGSSNVTDAVDRSMEDQRKKVEQHPKMLRRLKKDG